MFCWETLFAADLVVAALFAGQKVRNVFGLTEMVAHLS
jgi:hypothetical protein